MRIYACFCGANPHIMTTPVVQSKSMVACPNCMVVTQQHSMVEQAVRQWNNGDDQIFRIYHNGFFARIKRWWRGRNI